MNQKRKERAHSQSALVGQISSREDEGTCGMPVPSAQLSNLRGAGVGLGSALRHLILSMTHDMERATDGPHRRGALFALSPGCQWVGSRVSDPVEFGRPQAVSNPRRSSPEGATVHRRQIVILQYRSIAEGAIRLYHPIPALSFSWVSPPAPCASNVLGQRFTGGGGQKLWLLLTVGHNLRPAKRKLLVSDLHEEERIWVACARRVKANDYTGFAD